MARKLRVQYPGALYHVINRGNYRSDVFVSVGAANAFERALAEAAERHGWRVHAYVVMRNHFHLALETPAPNLSDGMKWLLGTFATRFNRFRAQQGHLFQGRYKALIVQDRIWLQRVIDYIHLNPVRANIVPPLSVAACRWGSLGRFVRRGRPGRLTAAWLSHAGLGNDDSEGWRKYLDYLAALAGDSSEQNRRQCETLSSGWAIGTSGWRRSLAREFCHLALDPNLAAEEAREIKESRWCNELERAMREAGKSECDRVADPPGSRWKIELAARLRRTVAAPYRWISEKLKMGSPLAVRVNVCRFANR